MVSISRLIFPAAILLASGVFFAPEAAAQSTGVVTFPNSVARKVGLSAGEMASIEYTVTDYILGNGGGRRGKLIYVIDFTGVSESGALIAGTGELTFDEPKGRGGRAIGDGPFYVQEGKLQLSALAVVDLNGAMYTTDSGTLNFTTYGYYR